MRLLEAQRAEVKAVARVERAITACEKAQRTLAHVVSVQEGHVADAEQRVVDAQAALVDVSGLDRAAQLLDVPARALRATVRKAADELDRDDTKSATKDAARTPAAVDRT